MLACNPGEVDEAEAIRCAEDAYMRGVPAMGGRFVAASTERANETWVVHWNVHFEDGAVLRDGGYTTLVSADGRTRLSWGPRPLADAVEDFELSHPPVDGEERLPAGWSLERIKDMGIAAPELVTRSVTVMENGVDEMVELSARVIVDLGGMCLVLCDNEEDWHMGQWADRDTIACWGSYGTDLEYAINAL